MGRPKLSQPTMAAPGSGVVATLSVPIELAASPLDYRADSVGRATLCKGGPTSISRFLVAWLSSMLGPPPDPSCAIRSGFGSRSPPLHEPGYAVRAPPPLSSRANSKSKLSVISQINARLIKEALASQTDPVGQLIASVCRSRTEEQLLAQYEGPSTGMGPRGLTDRCHRHHWLRPAASAPIKPHSDKTKRRYAEPSSPRRSHPT